MKSTSLAILLTLLAPPMSGCGGKNDAAPRLIEGGGIGDGAIDGRLNVYVVEAYTDKPLANAEVRVGEPGEDPLVGTTDSSGLYTFDGDLAGPQTITAIADGYVVATWFGADGANVTMPLDPTGTPSVPHARLEGTIAGWADLPDPATDHIILASVVASQTTRLGDPQNSLEQPTIGGLPGNVCVKTALASQCAYALNSRTGTVALSATILDVDTKGNTDDSDNTVEVMGYAFHLNTVVEDGVDQDGLVLEQTEASGLTDVTIDVADLPSGLDASGLSLGLELPDQGIMMLGVAQNPPSEIEVPLPSLSGDFAEGEYLTYAYAGELGVENGDASVILQHHITDLSQTIALGDWLDMASDLAVSGGTYSFTPVAASPLSTVTFYEPSGDKVWNIVLLDERTSFTLPGLDPNPLPSGSVDMGVSQFAAPDLDLGDFSIDEFWNVLERTSTSRTTLTP